MERFFKFFIRKLFTFLISFRYQVEIRGLEKIEGNGHLFLPNHVSILDATIFQVFTWKRLKARPFATTRFTKLGFLKPLFSLLRTIPVPDFTVGKNSVKIAEGERSFKSLLEALKQGDNVLFFPAGHLKISGIEKLGGASGLHQLLQREPNLSLVLVRSTGLWGSRFSPAPHQRTPDLIKELLTGLKIGFRHFFWIPKRKVLFEFETFTLPKPLPSRMELNRLLETWYNAPFGKEGEPVFPPFKPTPFFPTLEKREPTPLEKEIASEICQLTGKEVGRETHLFYEIGLDSLEASELFHVLEEKYHLTHLYTPELITPAHIALQIEKKWTSERVRFLKEKERRKHSLLLDQKISPRSQKPVTIDNISESLLKSSLKFAAFDEFLGLVEPKALWQRVECGRKNLSADERQIIPLFFPTCLDKALAALSVSLAGKEPLFLDQEKAKEEEGHIYSSQIVIDEWHGWDIGPSSDRVKELFENSPRRKKVPPKPLLHSPDIAVILENLVLGVPVVSGRPLWIKGLTR
jgi:1-acyl-sn-glycerol-3-phosphate acyltransferase